MYVTYFDEVKADPRQGRDHYVVGGICLPMGSIADAENALSGLAEEVFGSTELTPATEFHASDIYRGRGACKGFEIARRLEVLEKLASILSASDDIKRVYASIDTSKLYRPEQAPEFAFAHFVERVQKLVGRKSTSILIGDRDDEQIRNMVRDFARFRAQGTPWDFGIAITSIVDTVHFAQSHHSRMIQLADVYLFLHTHARGGRRGLMAEALTEIIKGKHLYPHRYKNWPTR